MKETDLMTLQDFLLFLFNLQCCRCSLVYFCPLRWLQVTDTELLVPAVALTLSPTEFNNELRAKQILRKLSSEIPECISLFPISPSVSLSTCLPDFLLISRSVQFSLMKLYYYYYTNMLPKHKHGKVNNKYKKHTGWKPQMWTSYLSRILLLLDIK